MKIFVLVFFFLLSVMVMFFVFVYNNECDIELSGYI